MFLNVDHQSVSSFATTLIATRLVQKRGGDGYYNMKTKQRQWNRPKVLPEPPHAVSVDKDMYGTYARALLTMLGYAPYDVSKINNNPRCTLTPSNDSFLLEWKFKKCAVFIYCRGADSTLLLINMDDVW